MTLPAPTTAETNGMWKVPQMSSELTCHFRQFHFLNIHLPGYFSLENGIVKRKKKKNLYEKMFILFLHKIVLEFVDLNETQEKEAGRGREKEGGRRKLQLLGWT